jgi:hypothetical protein
LRRRFSRCRLVVRSRAGAEPLAKRVASLAKRVASLAKRVASRR